MTLEATKDGVKFACTGDIGSGAVNLRTHTDMDNADMNVDIQLSEPVSLTFSLKYLVNFCKASGLSKRVRLGLSSEVPLLVEYDLTNSSYLRFYLAPKVGTDAFGSIMLMKNRLETMSRQRRRWKGSRNRLSVLCVLGTSIS